MNYPDKHIDTILIPWRLLGGLLLVNVVLVFLYISGPVNLKPFDSIVDTFSLLYTLLLAFLCFKGSPRLLGTPSPPVAGERSGRRFIPALLGVSILCLVLGQFIRIYGTISTQQEPIYPSLFHFIYLGAYPFLICAYLLLPSQNLSLLSRLRILFDSLMIMIAVITLYCYYILIPILATGKGTFLEKIVGSFFTAADIVLLFCLLLVALRVTEATLQRVLALLAVASLTAFVGHVAYLSGLLSDNYSVTIRANASSLFSLALVTVAAQMVSRMVRIGELSEHGPPVLLEEIRSTRWKVLLISAPVLIFCLLILSLWMPEKGEQYQARWVVVDIGGTLILLLLVLRQFLAMYEVNSLRKELREKNTSLNILNAQLEKLAASDPLTGVLNHRILVSKLDEELARAQEKNTTCSVIFIDIDHFKFINDKYGHLVGDRVLCQFAGLASSVLLSEDYLGRWGGEEFVAVLPGKGLSEELNVAEQIRTLVMQQAFAGEEDLSVTCSFGVSAYPQTATEQKDLISSADQAMYVAKRLGRNQVRTAHDPAVLRYAQDA